MELATLTIIITAHDEGRNVVHSLRCCERDENLLVAAKISANIVILETAATELTSSAVSAHLTDSRRHRMQSCDLQRGLSSVLDQVQSPFVALVRGGNLWSEGWLLKSVETLAQSASHLVCHPQLTIFFGERKDSLYHLDCNDPFFTPSQLLFENPWTEQFVTRTSLLQSIREIPETPGGDIIWDWYLETAASGVPHHCIPKTIHFNRFRNLPRVQPPVPSPRARAQLIEQLRSLAPKTS